MREWVWSPLSNRIPTLCSAHSEMNFWKPEILLTPFSNDILMYESIRTHINLNIWIHWLNQCPCIESSACMLVYLKTLVSKFTSNNIYVWREIGKKTLRFINIKLNLPVVRRVNFVNDNAFVLLSICALNVVCCCYTVAWSWCNCRFGCCFHTKIHTQMKVARGTICDRIV